MGIWGWIKRLFGRKEEDRPLVSIVLLLRRPRCLDKAIVKTLVQQALGITLSDDPNATEFVVGENPTYVLQYARGTYLIHNFPAPYVEDVQAQAEQIGELRRRKAFAEHRAWLSVDQLRGDPREAYAIIGKLVAHLLEDDCLALYHPESSRMVVCDPSMREKLLGPDPLGIFGASANPPVTSVPDDAAAMAAAVEEAGRRWPEFVEAFSRRTADQRFAIKAPFTDGDETEFMWVVVISIKEDCVIGTLGNEPVNVSNIKLGDPVRVPLADLNDWMYTRGDDDMVGGFTTRVLMEIEKRRRSRP